MYFFFSWVSYAVTVNINVKFFILILLNFYRCFKPNISPPLVFLFFLTEMSLKVYLLLWLPCKVLLQVSVLLLVHEVERSCFLTGRTALQIVLCLRDLYLSHPLLYGLCLFLIHSLLSYLLKAVRGQGVGEELHAFFCFLTGLVMS